MPVNPSREVPGFCRLTDQPSAGHPAQIPRCGEDRFGVQRPASVMVDLLEPEGPSAGFILQRSIKLWRADAGSDVVEQSRSVGRELPAAVVQQVWRSQARTFGALLDHGPWNPDAVGDRIALQPAHRPVREERVVVQRSSLEIRQLRHAPADCFVDGFPERFVHSHRLTAGKGITSEVDAFAYTTSTAGAGRNSGGHHDSAHHGPAPRHRHCG